MYPYDTTYSHTRYVSYNSSSSTGARVNTTECYSFWQLLAAVVRLHRVGTRACSRCFDVFPLICSRCIFHRSFLVFVEVLFFYKKLKKVSCEYDRVNG